MNVEGLVLAGGQSKRLGTRKYKIQWHGPPHWKYLTNLISQLCNKVYISTRSTFKDDFIGYNVLTDLYHDLGPMGGLLTFFEKRKNKACFAVACDLPMINNEVIDLIFQKRNSSKIATCAFSDKKGFPEPLLAIWENQAYDLLNEFKTKNNYSLQDIVENNPVEMVSIRDQFLLNVNTREDYFLVKSRLPYLPVDCGFYDHFEEAIIKGKKCTIEFFDSGTINSESVLIKGLETVRGQEYLILGSGRQLRLDQIMTLNDIEHPLI